MKNSIRIVLGTAVILLVPFVFSWDWGRADFVTMSVLLLGTGFIYEFFARKVTTTKQRMIFGLVLIFALVLIVADLSVGVFNIRGFSGS